MSLPAVDFDLARSICYPTGERDRRAALRASAMPLLFRCAQSRIVPRIRIEEASEPANLGTAAHEAFRSLVEEGAIDWDALPALAVKYEVDGDELRRLCHLAENMWPDVASSFRGAATEVESSSPISPDVEITGHLDLVSLVGTIARGGDWKTGRKDRDYSQQMRTYAWLLLQSDPLLTEATVTILWVRDQSIENYTMRREDAGAWLASLRVQLADSTYRPGPHCMECSREHECPARAMLARSHVSSFASAETIDQLSAALVRDDLQFAALAPMHKLELYHRAKAVHRLADLVLDACREDIERHGPIQGDEGRLVIDEQERRELDVRAAWPVLEDAGFRDEDFAAACKLSVSQVETIIAKKAGRGKGAAAVRKLRDALTDAGAIQKRLTRTLQERRT